MEPSPFEVHSIGEETSSDYELVELEDMIANFNSQHGNLSQLRSFQSFTRVLADDARSGSTLDDFFTFAQSDEFTFETLHTDDDDASVVPSLVSDNDASISIQDDEDDDEEFELASTDQDNIPDDSSSSSSSEQSSASSRRRSLLEQTEVSEHSHIVASERVAPRCLASAVDGVSSRAVHGNVCFAETERIHNARERRIQALKRYQNVLHNTSTFSPAKSNTPYAEDSSHTQATERTDSMSSFPKTSFVLRSSQQMIPPSPEPTRNSLNEIRTRQRKSMQDFIKAFDKVRRNTIGGAPPPTRQKKVQSLTPKKLSLWPNLAGRWNKR